MRKGFTLVELLAVIVILAIILAITIPGISGIISNTTKGAFESNAKMILKQLEYEKLKDDSFDVTTTSTDTISNYNLSNDNYDDLRVGLINNKPYIVVVGKNKWAGLKACGTYQNINIVDVTDTETCESITPAYADYDQVKGVNRPKLATGMTPIKWNGTTWVDTTEADEAWYNYTTTDKQWANTRTADGSMWVWIPRYAYQIATNYHTSTAGTINVKFLKNTTDTASDNSTVDTVPTYSGSSQTNYISHPAFTFGSTKLTGIWIAKFEMSGTTDSLDSKPGITSLRNTTVGNMFTASRNMETNNKYGWALASNLNADGTFTTDTNNVDIHMMKNMEWGAVAYLSQSLYGKNAEITVNSSSDFYTGGGSGTAYTTNVGQSTTGNIYGIYDISGGAYEYVMANFNNITSGSGLTPSSINDKYIDRYTAYDSTKYGDAVYETSTSTSGSTSWYGDHSYMIYTTYPWAFRGGHYGYELNSGAFFFSYMPGGTHNDTSWRSVVLVGTGI